MDNKQNWRNLQLSMNNFHINNLMSYMDIYSYLDKAVNNADTNNNEYYYAVRIYKMINDLDHKDDFILDTNHNRELFNYIHNCMINIIGFIKLDDPTTSSINKFINTERKNNPEAFNKFNLKVHQQYHLSTQQAFIDIMNQK